MTCGSQVCSFSVCLFAVQLLLLSADVGGGLERGRFPRKMRRFTAALTLLTYQRYTEFHLQVFFCFLSFFLSRSLDAFRPVLCSVASLTFHDETKSIVCLCGFFSRYPFSGPLYFWLQSLGFSMRRLGNFWGFLFYIFFSPWTRHNNSDVHNTTLKKRKEGERQYIHGKRGIVGGGSKQRAGFTVFVVCFQNPARSFLEHYPEVARFFFFCFSNPFISFVSARREFSSRRRGVV